ncbi:hypothetical protein PCANB_001938 [Pneumocystis canis]|nr:hypothetical protein PCANB_001938 [Pneumocystis canis]
MWGYLVFFTLFTLLYENIYAANINQTNNLFQRLIREEQIEVLSDNIKKSGNDPSSYRYIKLANEMEVLLVSNPNTQNSGASMSVGVGYFSDPDEIPGLAHFCEHLLFMGTKKYPDEDDFSSFLSTYSGIFNAFTSAEETNYHFQILSEKFNEALDRFSQFFISPLFSRSSVEREARAVDSEHQKNMQSDNWRLFELEKFLLDGNSAYSKFSTGNYDTLITQTKAQNIDILEALLKFHSKYYSSNIMKLVLYGKESLDDLQNIAFSFFSQVPNKKIQKPEFNEKPHTENDIGRLCWYKPVMDFTSLDITFPVETQRKRYKSNPFIYLKYVIGYQASGSIIDFLKQKGWATEISVYTEYIVANIDFFRIGITLTSQGLDHYEDVILVIFEFLEMLKKTGPQEWIYNELMAISKLSFRFNEDFISPMEYTSFLSTLMQESYLDYSDILSPSVLQFYNKDHITELLSFLRPDNFFLLIASQAKPGNWNRREKWYNSPYMRTRISKKLKQKLSNLTENLMLKLPVPNPFIPKNFIIKPPKENVYKPSLIYNSSLVNVWFKQDDTFSTPRTHAHFLFKSPLYHGTSRLAVGTIIYVKLINNAMRDIQFYASVAGSDIYLSAHKMGLELHIDAYTDSIYELFKTFIEITQEYQPLVSEFQQYKSELLLMYKNFDIVMPYRHLFHDIDYLYDEIFWPSENLYHSANTLTYTDIIAFSIMRFFRLSVDALVVGSVSPNFSYYIGLLMKNLEAVPIYPYQHLFSRTQLLDEGSNYIYELDVANPDEKNSAILYSLQLGSLKDSKLLALVYLLRHIIKDPAFHQLRTKEQLGYIVKTSVFQMGHIMDFRIIIQSLKDPLYLEMRINAFLYKYAAIIDTISEEQFRDNINALITLIGKNFENLDSEVYEYWDSISSGLFDFERHSKTVEVLKNIKKDDLVDMFYKYIYPNSLYRKKLSVHLKSKTLEEVSPKDLSPSRLYSFLECENLKIPYNKFISFLESSDKLSEFEEKLIDYFSRKYPNVGVSKKIKIAFKFLKEQYSKIKQKIRKNYNATHFSDAHAFKSSLKLSPAPLPLLS